MALLSHLYQGAEVDRESLDDSFGDMCCFRQERYALPE